MSGLKQRNDTRASDLPGAATPSRAGVRGAQATLSSRSVDHDTKTNDPSMARSVERSTADAADDESPRRGAIARWLSGAPPWSVSLLFHLVLLLVLAFCQIANVQEKLPVFVAVTPVDPSDSLEELSEVEMPELEESETESLSLEPVEVDPGEIAFADVTSPAELTADAIGSLDLPETTIDEIGALFGKDGPGMADIGDGLKAAASFFGSKSSGRRFVFVVDNSNSMTRGRFETALAELIKTVDQLTPRQYFYVIFFSDTAYRMFHPDPASGLVPATDRNKELLRAWLYSVQMCLHTRGEEAMKTAIALRPDVIYILGDGAFTDNTEKLLTAPHNRRIPIHTLGMEVNEAGERQLKAIAAANHGTYRAVRAAPAARLAAQKNPIPRNRTRGAVWGRALPVSDSKPPAKNKKKNGKKKK